MTEPHTATAAGKTVSKSKPEVSVTIVLYNSAATLPALIRSLRPQILSGFAEVVFVDNASPDDSVAIVQTQLPEATLLRAPRNLGFAGGCNLAWPLVRGDYWLLLNPDTIVPPDGLEKLREWMDARSAIGAVSPGLCSPDGRRQGGVPRRFQRISLTLLELSRLHLLMPADRRANLFLGSYWRGGDHENVDWIPGAAMMVRRAAVASAGLPSDQFFMYGEDVEWCWRMRRANWRIGYLDSVLFIHGESTSALATWNEDERELRMLAGINAANHQMYGNLYGRALWLLNTAALAVEAVHPGRHAHERKRARASLRAHTRILFGRKGAMATPAGRAPL